MKQSLTAVLLVSFLVGAGGADASLDRSIGGARSQGMGGAFVSVVDDGSALFINPAGMVSSRQIGLYLDYGEPKDDAMIRESRVGLCAPAGGTSVGIGWFRRDARDVSTGDRFIVGAARKLFEGTPGSFLSVGAGVSVGRASRDERREAAGGASTKSDWTADAGIILKPLPVISFAYSVCNVRNVSLGAAPEEAWSRVGRWGVSYFWEERVILSFDREDGGSRKGLHYGVSVKTAAPVELMVGFSEGSAAGGVRWTGERVRAAVSFESGDGGSVTWTGACEIALHRIGTERAK